MTDTRDEVERIRLRARGGVTMWSDADVQNLLARIATLEAERDALAARLPSPAAVRAARVLAASVTEQAVFCARKRETPPREAANDLASVLRDLVRTYLGRYDEGGDVDATTLAMIALDVDGCTTLGELEEMARELREVE